MTQQDREVLEVVLCIVLMGFALIAGVVSQFTFGAGF